MAERSKWAYIIDKDEFVRLSLNKILKKYGFEVEEAEDLSQLEKGKKDLQNGIILADMDIDVLERSLPHVKKWTDRFILMTPLVTEESSCRLKKIGIHHVIKKPVEPGLLKRLIRKMTSNGQSARPTVTKKGTHSRFNQKGGEKI
jgi:DNA-binding NtrC family response regulator